MPEKGTQRGAGLSWPPTSVSLCLFVPFSIYAGLSTCFVPGDYFAHDPILQVRKQRVRKILPILSKLT